MSQKPNILFIMTDQQRADAMGCSGGWVKTPNLDRIAAEGVHFQNAVTNSPVCVPARVSLATGRYPHNTTVIAFSSDHGEMNGDHGMIYKGHFLNGALRVPLLLRTPATAGNGTGGAVTDTLAEWFDIGPTLAELAGANLQHQQFAQSMCPVLENPDAEHRSVAVSEICREMMIMDRRWKCVFNREGRPYLLFDQESDPEEKHNRVYDPDTAEVVERLRKEAFEHLLRTQFERNSSSRGA